MKYYKSVVIIMIVVVFIVLGIGILLLPKCYNHKKELRIAMNPWPGYEIFYLARTLGYYEKATIRLLEVSSTSMVLRGLRNGTLDAGCVTLDEALTLLQDNIDVKVVLVIDESHGGDVIMAKPEIQSIKDLKGKRIGIENTTVSAILLDAALLENNMRIEDISLVSMPLGEQLQEYLDGKVDAVATFEPFKSQLLAANAKILFSSEKIPGRILDVLIVRGDVVEKYSSELTVLLKSYFKALTFSKENQDSTLKLMEKRLGKTVKSQFDGLYLPTLYENRIYLDGNNPSIIHSAQFLKKTMVARKLLRHNFIVKPFYNPSFLPQ